MSLCNRMIRKSLTQAVLRDGKQSLIAVTLLSIMTVLNVAVAKPGNADIVKQWCAEANRAAPVIATDECSTCHNTSNFAATTANKTAFLAKDLSVFCPKISTAAPYELYDPKAPPTDVSTVHNVELVVQEKQMTIAAGVTQELWTYNGKVPGPVIRARVGDTIRVHFVNPPTNKMPHSIDFHASEMAWNDHMQSIKPGEEMVFDWTANHAGVWMYHCGTPPALHHIASGMYGMVIIEPKGGLEPVDHEFALVQSEFYTGKQGANTNYKQEAKPNGSPNYIVFNGVAFQYRDHPIEVGTGKKIRFFVLNAGPSEDSSFHIVGTIFNRVIKEGVELSAKNPKRYGSQAVDLAPAQGAIIELTAKEDGLYPIVTHAFNFVGLGALGLLKAGDGDPKN